MISYINKKNKELNNIVETIHGISLCFIQSEKGLGKTSFINEFTKEFDYNYIYNRCGLNNAIPFNIILDDTTNYIDDIKIYIANKLSNVDKNIIIFDNYELASNEEKILVEKLITYCIYREYNNLLFIIIIDSSKSMFFPEFLCVKEKIYIEFKRWNHEELSEFLISTYPNINISKNSINIITKHSFGNVQKMIEIIEYLKSKHVIRFEFNSYICDEISSDTIYLKFKDMVLERYNSLPTLLKDTIDKASAIGEVFNSETLENAFSILNAQHLLEEIELVSSLIKQKIDFSHQFDFSTYESYLLIYQSLNEVHRNEWNNILGDYFFQLSKDSKLSDSKICDYLTRTAIYYKNTSKKQENSIHIYLKLAVKFFNLGLFNQTIQTLDEIKKLDHKINVLTNNIYCDMLILEYFSYKKIYDFKSAYSTLVSIESYFENEENKNYWLTYENSLILYELGNTIDAYIIITKLYKKIKDTRITSYSFIITKVKTCELLAALEETLGYTQYPIHFKEAMKYAKQYCLKDEYFRLLRKSNMVFQESIADKHLNLATNYFHSRNKLEYAMCLHNLGTMHFFDDSINEKYYKYIECAKNIFFDYGFNGVIYSINSSIIWNVRVHSEYSKGLEMLSLYVESEKDCFLKLVLLNNIAVLQRKLKRFDDLEATLNKIEIINNLEKIPYFNAYLFLQKAYYYKEKMNYYAAYEYFKKYYFSGFNDYTSIYNAAIKNILDLSMILKKDISREGLDISNEILTFSNYFYENDIFFCDLEFWE